MLGGLLAVTSFLMVGSSARGAVICTVNWVGAGGGFGGDDVNWNDPGNWQFNAVPASTDNVCAPSSANIQLTGTQGYANNVNLQGSLTIYGVGLNIYDTTGPSLLSTIHDLTLAGYSGIGEAGVVQLTGTATLGNGGGYNVFYGGAKTLVSGATATIGDTLYVGDSTNGGVTFTNEGTMSYNAGALYVGEDSEFLNKASFTATFNGWYIDDTYVTVAGRFRNQGAGTFDASDSGQIQMLNENDGTFNVNGGTTCLCVETPVGDADTGTYNVAAGTKLTTYGGYLSPEGRHFGAGSKVDGDGTFRVEYPGVQFDTTDSVTHFESGGGVFTGSGELTVDDTMLIDTFNIGLRGTFKLVANSASTTNLVGTMYLDDDAVFENKGSLTSTSGNNLFGIDSNSKVDNTASGTMTASYPTGGTFLNYCSYTCATTGQFDNHGTIHTDALPGQLWGIYNASFDNDGTLVVDSGSVNVQAPSTADDDGEYQTTDADQVIYMNGGYDRTISASGKVTGPGTLWVQSGTVTWGSATPISNLRHSGGNITGSPTINGTALFDGGNLVGPGTVTIASGATAIVGPSSLALQNGITLDNQGTMTLPTGVDIYDTGTLFKNEGTMNVSAGLDGLCACSGSPIFENTSTGVVNVNVPLSTFSINIDTKNDGTINVTAGTLSVGTPNSATTTDTGTWNASAGAQIWFNTTRYFTGATLNGNGIKRTGGGTVFNGTVSTTAGTLSLTGGTIGNGTVTVTSTAKITQTGAVCIDGGTLQNQGTWDWLIGDLCMYNAANIVNDGTWNVKNPGYMIYDAGPSWTGGVTNSATGIINKSNAFVVHWYTGPVQNNGLISVTGGGLSIENLANFDTGTSALNGGTYRMTNGRITAGAAMSSLNARVEFLPGGVWRDYADTVNAFDSLASITAAGELVIDRGGMSFGALDNAGLLEVRNTNNVDVQDQTTHPTTVDRVRDAGSKITITTAATMTNNGTITGNGTVDADLIDPGTINPGNSPGIVTVDGPVTMSGSSVTNIEVNGATVGTGYDRLASTGAVTLGGALNISGTLTPTSGTFTIVTGTSVTGTFSSITGQNIGNGYYYAVVYNANNVQLVVTALPTFSIGDVTQNEGNAGTTAFQFLVSLSGPAPFDVTFDVSTANGTATVAGNDYNGLTSIPVTILAGNSSQVVAVSVKGDVLNEADEDFFLNATNVTNATVSDAQGKGTITNDDPLPSLSINDVTHNEGNAGTTAYTFDVTLSAASGRNVTVNWASADGTATAASGDYASASGSLTFLPGETTKQVTVNGNGDLLNEGDDVFNVVLSGQANASLADGSGDGTLTNDDPLPTVSINDVTASEGNFGITNYTFTVSLDTASGRNVSVDWNANSGTATAGSDFVGGGATLTFLPGETSKQVTVAVVGDTANEANETFTVDLTNLVDVAASDVSGLGTINNDDGVPSASINNVVETEGTGGVHIMSFTVTLTNPSGSVITVDYASGDGTAKQPRDYTAVGGTLSFNPGDTVRNVQVPITTDASSELNETFTVTLSNPTNATISTAVGTGTINNDDTDFVVDDTADAVDANPGDGACETAAYSCTLRAAVQESNSVGGTQNITLQTGALYQLGIAGSGEDLAATGDLDVLDTTTIFGNNATVDGGDLDRVFHTNAASVTITNLTIRNGTATGTFPLNSGGGLLADGTGSITLTNVTSTSNDAAVGGGLTVNATGGMTLTNVTASNNTVSSTGGGAWLNADGTVTGGSFTNNTATVDCGGGLWIKAVVTVTGSSVTNNTAGICGGGILTNGGVLTMSSTTVSGNQGGTFGGGVLLEADATLSGNSISSNTAQYGAGLTQIVGTMSLSGGSVTGNSAVGTNATGGGLTLRGTASLTGTTISGNTAQNGAGVTQTLGTVTMTGVTISGNTASAFGGGVLGLSGSVNDSQITGNTAAVAGGLFGLQTGSITLNGTEVANNNGASQGGVVFAGAGTINRSTIAQNSGVGVYAVGPSLTVTRSTVSSNAGAGIQSSATASVTDTTVTANGVGGVIVTGGTFTIKNTIVADQAGGADCTGVVASGGYNHASDLSCALLGTGDVEGVSANLGILANNGGLTRTHLPNLGSPVIDTGDPACVGPDQRGAPRPNGAGCDKGAVEA